MRNRMLACALLAGLVFLMGCSVNVSDRSTVNSTTQGRDGVLVHISSGPEDAHRAMMALNMAVMMSEKHPVLVYCDIEAVRLLTTDAASIVMEPFGSSHEMLDTLAARGVTVMACRGCMKKAGLNAEALRPGVRLGERDAFFDFTDGRIVTLDY